VAFLGEALSKILESATIRYQAKLKADGGLNASVALLSADGNDALESDLKAYLFWKVYSWNGSLDFTGGSEQINGDAGALNAEAITIAGGRMEAAVNGFSAFAGVVDETDRPPGNPLVAAIIQPGTNATIQSITIYDPLADTTGLSELSAVG
jgi:hypothetical protein